MEKQIKVRERESEICPGNEFDSICFDLIRFDDFFSGLIMEIIQHINTNETKWNKKTNKTKEKKDLTKRKKGTNQKKTIKNNFI